MGNWRVWLHGLGAAVVGGAASAGAAVLAAPETFNFSHAGIEAFAKVIFIGAAIPALAYLKRSPLPGGEEKQ